MQAGWRLFFSGVDLAGYDCCVRVHLTDETDEPADNNLRVSDALSDGDRPKEKRERPNGEQARTERTGGAALAGGIGRVWSVRGGRDDGGAVGGEEEARGRGAGEREDLGAGER